MCNVLLSRDHPLTSIQPEDALHIVVPHNDNLMPYISGCYSTDLHVDIKNSGRSGIAIIHLLSCFKLVILYEPTAGACNI